jgi:hypothetical protein
MLVCYLLSGVQKRRDALGWALGALDTGAADARVLVWHRAHVLYVCHAQLGRTNTCSERFSSKGHPELRRTCSLHFAAGGKERVWIRAPSNKRYSHA